MQVQCPHCGKKLDSPEGQAGQVVQCGACGGQMQLPAVTEPAADVAAPQVYGGGLSRPGQKRCPHCGEGVVGDEPICPHCDTVFDETKRGDRRAGPDWERLAREGVWTRLWNTFKGVSFNPVQTFDRLRLHGYGPALTYALICHIIGAVFAAIYQVLQQSLQMGAGMGRGGLGAPAMAGMMMVVMFFAVLVFAPIMGIAMLFLSSAFTHVVLIVNKSANASFEATFRVTSYAFSSAYLWTAIPLCGGLIGYVWGYVATVIGIARTHRISYGKAAFGVLLIPGILLTLMILFIALMVIFVFAAASR